MAGNKDRGCDSRAADRYKLARTRQAANGRQLLSHVARGYPKGKFRPCHSVAVCGIEPGI